MICKDDGDLTILRSFKLQWSIETAQQNLCVNECSLIYFSTVAIILRFDTNSNVFTIGLETSFLAVPHICKTELVPAQKPKPKIQTNYSPIHSLG
jgi:hypothetical protein